MRLASARLFLTAPAVALLAACTSFMARPAEPGSGADPLCADRVGSAGLSCPPAMPGVGPAVTPGVGGRSGSRDLRAAAQSNLYGLRARQDTYFRQYTEYAKWLEELNFGGSAGVSVRILRATRTGWSAVAQVRGQSVECAIFEGDVPAPRAYVNAEDVAACNG